MESRIQNRKCTQCGLINFIDSAACRRCDAVLDDGRGWAAGASAGRSRLLVLAGSVLVLLFLCRLSLVLTSDALSDGQQDVVTRATILLEREGFSKEVLVLRHLTSFRATDNWWNRFVGHGQAYAATNFPFEVVTLYPRFFDVAVDDRERAVILLHESHHLLGRDEETALEQVWRAKPRLGWTVHGYGRTRVFRNTRVWTHSSLPHLFMCGSDGRSDCYE